jgi:hypothetical protein
MKLNIETRPASKLGKWIWAVRSDDDKQGSTCLALGTNAKSMEAALEIAEAVAKALEPIFCKAPQ